MKKFLRTLLLSLVVLSAFAFGVMLLANPIEVITKARWDLLSDQQRSHICNEYRLSPAATEAAFKRNGSLIADESWTYLQTALNTDCT